MTPEAMIEYEGEEAFSNGVAAGDSPYSFRRSKYWDAKDYDGFNAVRWKLDAWMKGWLRADKQEKEKDAP